MRPVLEKFLERIWYGGSRAGIVLLPLSWLYALLFSLRRRRESARRHGGAVPVIVVGNLTVGGTGKTPIVIWLAEQLSGRGLRPGIVTRGYRGSAGSEPVHVSADTSAAVAGDEAVLIARRLRCPVVACVDRVQAVAALANSNSVDVIISDDGLQHFALQADYEIVVFDGKRGPGNGRLLPAGPLRETLQRLQSVDKVLVNGPGWSRAGALSFVLRPGSVVQLSDGERRSLAGFAGQFAHAHAAIGHPDRFFQMLRDAGVSVEPHAWPDHAEIPRTKLVPDDGAPVLVTEKDAVKLSPPVPVGVWSVNVDVDIDAAAAQLLLSEIVERIGHDRNSQ